MSKCASSNSNDKPSTKCARHETDSQSPLCNCYAWAILENFLTSLTITYSDTLAKPQKILTFEGGGEDEEAEEVLGDDEVEILDKWAKNPFLNLEANEGDSNEEEEIEINAGSSRCISTMPDPAHRQNFSDTIDRIKEGIKAMGVGQMGVPQYTIAIRTYLFHVLATVRQFLVDHLEKKGLPVVVLPWI
ncbi:hypothetical protein P692DRAFT_20820992 [Suillus brevipes Sb2]|nr:hypothetical protein P692DRAFT_20820992 [Suillus brevipes Sb2]